MYLFYNSKGVFEWCIGADSPINDLITPKGYTALYLDNINDQHIIKNYSNYKIRDGVVVYDPIPESIRLSFEQQSKIEEINTSCNQEILRGFDSSVLRGESHHYKFDMEYQANFSEMATMLSIDSSITEINWPTDGAMVKYTKDQFINLLKEASYFKSNKLSHYFDLKAQILGCQTIDDIRLINW